MLRMRPRFETPKSRIMALKEQLADPAQQPAKNEMSEGNKPDSRLVSIYLRSQLPEHQIRGLGPKSQSTHG